MVKQTRPVRRPVPRSARVRQVWYRLRRPWGVTEPASQNR